jgi:hypothetical protein
MKPLEPTLKNLALAKQIIWFEPAERALAEPARFLSYAFRYADIEDMKRLQVEYGKDNLANALINAPPGIIDPRSWAYWNLILRDLSPPPPMPTRTFPDDPKATQS